MINITKILIYLFQFILVVRDCRYGGARELPHVFGPLNDLFRLLQGHLLINVLVGLVLRRGDDGVLEDEGHPRVGVVFVEHLEIATLAFVPEMR